MLTCGPESFHFDAKSALLLKREGKRGTIEYADYRNVGGVRVPFSIKSTGSQYDITITLEEVRLDADIDDKIFARPQ